MALNPIIEAWMGARDDAIRLYEGMQDRALKQQQLQQEAQQAQERNKLLIQQITQEADLANKKNALLAAERIMEAKKGAALGYYPVQRSFPMDQESINENLNRVSNGQDLITTGSTIDIPGIGTILVQSPEEYAKAIAPIENVKTKGKIDLEKIKGLGRLQVAQYNADEAANRQKSQQNFLREEHKLDRNLQRELNAARLAMRAKQIANGPEKYDSLVTRIMQQHDSNPIFKRYVTANEASQFVNSLSNKTVSPADDIGLIYAFAKAMDPESVVREGEYKTVQDYAQALVDKLGFKFGRIWKNSQFLTPEARQKMKATIQKKTDSTATLYRGYRKTIADRINKITGKNDGDVRLGNVVEFMNEQDITHLAGR